MRKRLASRVANGRHTWGDIDTRKAIKILEDEIRLLRRSLKKSNKQHDNLCSEVALGEPMVCSLQSLHLPNIYTEER